jgi:magnesium transporter
MVHMMSLRDKMTVRLWHEGHSVRIEDPVDDAYRDVTPGDLLWIDLLDPTEHELTTFGQHFGITRLGIDDVLSPHERTKVVRHSDHLSFVCYALNEKAAPPGSPVDIAFEFVRISGFVFGQTLITIRASAGVMGIVDFSQRLEEERRLLTLGPGYLVYAICDSLVNGYFHGIEQLEDRLEDIEDSLFDESLSREMQRAVYHIRRDLARLRRSASPMREVVNDFARHFASVPELTAYFGDAYDHALRSSEWIDSLRDTISFIVETNLSLQDARMNEIMKKLAGWAAIISVPTMITGYFGQNVPFFGYGDPAGWVFSSLLLVGSALILWIVFKRQGWI